MDHELSIDWIMSNMTYYFTHFMLNYHMQSKETSIPELINLLKTVEPTLKKKMAKIVMLVKSSVSKKGSKNNNKKKKPMKEKGGVTKKKVKKAVSKGSYFHCGQDGYWRRNCKAYLGSLKKASDAPSTLGMFINEVNTISHKNQWVLDIGCSSQICTNVQGLRDNRQLNKGESDL